MVRNLVGMPEYSLPNELDGTFDLIFVKGISQDLINHIDDDDDDELRRY
jgi:hypothetical protein